MLLETPVRITSSILEMAAVVDVEASSPISSPSPPPPPPMGPTLQQSTPILPPPSLPPAEQPRQSPPPSALQTQAQQHVQPPNLQQSLAQQRREQQLQSARAPAVGKPLQEAQLGPAEQGELTKGCSLLMHFPSHTNRALCR